MSSTFFITRRINRDLVPVDALVSAAITSSAASTSRGSARPVTSQVRVARWSTSPQRPCAV